MSTDATEARIVFVCTGNRARSALAEALLRRRAGELPVLVESRVLGAIQIGDRSSYIEVPDTIADDIVTALKATTIRGKKVSVRRDLKG